jgi:hypothetical protein
MIRMITSISPSDMVMSPRRGGQRLPTEGLADAEQSISSAMVPMLGTLPVFVAI